MRSPLPIPALVRLSSLLVLVATFALPAQADEVFSRPPSPTGGVNASAWTTPDGSDSDMYAWEDFTLTETQTITEVRWTGGYSLGGIYGMATDFRISFFDSTANGFYPIITGLPEHESQETVIATFHTNNNAQETPMGGGGGVTMYSYRFVLPQPVTLQGGVKYWFRVAAGQPGYPDWGWGTSTPGAHFKFNQGASMFQSWPNDLSFSLHATWANLGNGLAGPTSEPVLKGSGPLTPGTFSALRVTNAEPLMPAWIVAGGSEVNLPIAGGLLIPDPQIILSVGTDATGALVLPFKLDASTPPGFRIVAQAWVLDPGAPEWLTATNGLSGVY